MSTTAALIGWSLQTFSVPIVLAIAWTCTAPHMLLVALFAAVMAVASLILPSVIYIIAVAAATNGENNSSNAMATTYSHDESTQVALNVVNLFFSFVSQEACRVLICYALILAELKFRHRNQSLSGSKFGTAFTGLAAGAGFGTMLAVHSVGTSINLSTFASYNSIVAYDFRKCPQMPLLQMQSLTGLFMILCNMGWTVIVLQCVTAIVVRKRIKEQLANGGGGGGASTITEGPNRSQTAQYHEYSEDGGHHQKNYSPRATLLSNRRQAINNEEQLSHSPSDGNYEQLHSMKNLKEDNDGGRNYESTTKQPLEDTGVDNTEKTKEGKKEISEKSQTDTVIQKESQEKSKKSNRKRPKLPPPPLPPLNYALVNPSELSVTQGKLFLVCVYILHFVFKAVSLVNYNNVSTNFATTGSDTSIFNAYYSSESYKSLFSDYATRNDAGFGNYAYDTSFYNGNTDVGYSGGCTAVLAVQSVISIFAISLACIVAWNDRR